MIDLDREPQIYTVERPDAKFTFNGLGRAIAYCERLYNQTKICAKITSPKGKVFYFEPKAHQEPKEGD